MLANGVPLAVRGKRGTGDNRFEPFGSKTSNGGSWIRNRTAAFVFFIDDQFYGTVTNHVQGSVAGEYRFTSALPVQLFTQLLPALLPMFERPCDTCTAFETAVPRDPQWPGE